MQVKPSSISAQADALARSGQYLDAYKLLTSSQAAKDAGALFTLALWRLTGDVIHRDLTASRELFRQAAQCGDPLAARIHINFVANGTGAPPDWSAALLLLEKLSPTDAWARTQLNLISQMQISSSGDPVGLPSEIPLSKSPQVSSFARIFSPAECAFLIGEARPALAPSTVIDPYTGHTIRNPIRTSDAMAFPFLQESPAIHALNRRIAAVTKTNVRQGEPLQVLRYGPGQEYKAHIDAVSGDKNQRIVTLLVYLNEQYEGGETIFVRTGLRFKGKCGDGLMFHNALPDGRPDELAQHAGSPVHSGEKLICSRWIRQRPFLLPPPVPLLLL